jgi:SHS2 domain-containing protein
MKTFEVLDVSGDIGLRAYGKDVREAFINAAAGMYSLITDTANFMDEKSVFVTVENDSLEGLLVAWLNELIFQFDAYGFIGKHIEISDCQVKSPIYTLKGCISGEEFDAARHESKLLIKAATYHDVRVENKGDGWEADVIFDI